MNGRILITVAFIVLIGMACGNEAAERREEATAQREARHAEQQAAYERCRDVTIDLLEGLDELNARLDVGLNFDDYSQLVSDNQVAYSGVADDVEADDERCLAQVAVRLEEAHQEYVDAYRRWDRCIQNTFCDTDDIGLQGYWSDAQTKLDLAKASLDGMEPAPASSPAAE